jgi:hypothetical protein
VTGRVDRDLRVEGDPDRLTALLLGDPDAWLPRPLRAAGTDRWATSLAAGPLSQEVHLHVGPPWERDGRRWRVVRWAPRGASGRIPADGLLPAFEGRVRWSEEEDGVVLRLEGRYAPPGGRLGDALDALALHRVADATADGLLRGVAGRLQAAAAQERSVRERRSAT